MMFILLPGYDDSHCCDLPNADELTAIPNEFIEVFISRRRRLLNVFYLKWESRRNYFGKYQKTPIYDKKDEFKQEIMFRAIDKIHISQTFDGVAELNLLDHGDCSTLLHLQYTFAKFATIVSIEENQKNELSIE